MTTKVSRDAFEKNLTTKTAEDIRALLKCKPRGHLTKAELTELAWQEYQGEKPSAELIETGPQGKKWQGRLRVTERQRTTFRRAGYVFSAAWTELDPQPTGEVLARLQAEKAIQLREA